jgi:uncharacterized protein YneR
LYKQVFNINSPLLPYNNGYFFNQKKSIKMPTENQQSTPADLYAEQKNAWYFDNETDEAMGIETYRYDNGGVSKRCKLSDGTTAVCHRLKGKDRQMIKRIAGDQKDKFEDALIAVSTKIDDKSIVLEDLDNLWFDDAMTLQTMASTLNFT